MSNTLQINNTSNLGNYLGYPLKPSYSSADFNFITHKLRQKLQSQKTNHLSFARRCQLVQSTLNQIPNYHIRIFLLPKKIHNQIDTINRNFLWGHSEGSRKIHFVGWNKITKSKSNWGSCIKKSSNMNVAFMEKLIWELHTSNHKLWVTLFSHRYNYPSHHFCPNSSFCYKGIFKDMDIYSSNVSFNIKNGKTTNLQQDR